MAHAPISIVDENSTHVHSQHRRLTPGRVAARRSAPYHREAMSVSRLLILGLILCAQAAPRTVSAEPAPVPAAIADTRERLSEDNPATFWEAEGEALWHAPAGPRQQSLERCDLGEGPGVVRGAMARLPRWFADAGQVMDLEQRLMWCMVELQGLTPGQAAAQPFGNGARHGRLESLSAWIAAASRGLAVHVPAEHPEEQRLLRLGSALFRYRGGDHDLACASCHSQDGRRIRLQALANLTRPEDARAVWTSWPAYRISQGQLRTMQYRIRDCFRQQRFPEPRYGSEAVTALSLYLAHLAEGGVMAAPAVKR